MHPPLPPCTNSCHAKNSWHKHTCIHHKQPSHANTHTLLKQPHPEHTRKLGLHSLPLTHCSHTWTHTHTYMHACTHTHTHTLAHLSPKSTSSIWINLFLMDYARNFFWWEGREGGWQYKTTWKNIHKNAPGKWVNASLLPCTQKTTSD